MDLDLDVRIDQRDDGIEVAGREGFIAPPQSLEVLARHPG
jgi:hypothetical protein